MGFQLALEMQTTPLNSVKNQHPGSAIGGSGDGFRDGIWIVAVDPLNVSTERCYAWSEIVTRDHVSRATETLQAILVDEYDKISQPLMDGEVKGLPAATLLPFAVGAKTEDLMIKTLVACRESKAGRQRRTVSERSGGKHQPGNAGAARVAGKQSVVTRESP